MATTLETVRSERPATVYFRLVRGPVPHVLEQFELNEVEGRRSSATTASWAPTRGRSAAGGEVAGKWEAAVRASFDAVKAEAERWAAG
jgi:hypothetical protein